MIIVEPRPDTKDDPPAPTASSSRGAVAPTPAEAPQAARFQGPRFHDLDDSDVEEQRLAYDAEQPPPYAPNEEDPLLPGGIGGRGGRRKTVKDRARTRFIRSLLFTYMLLMTLWVVAEILARRAGYRYKFPVCFIFIFILFPVFVWRDGLTDCVVSDGVIERFVA